MFFALLGSPSGRLPDCLQSARLLISRYREVSFMNSKTASILANPNPGNHIVYPYTDENRLVEAVGIFAGSGLCTDEAVVSITTYPHRRAIEQRLKACGFGVAFLEQEGQLIFLDAETTMEKFMVDGMPDEPLFKDLTTSLIENARNSGAGQSPRKVRLFGEMVSLLWTEGRVEAAQRLEELWNEVLERHSVPLLCTYSMADPGKPCLPTELLLTHSHTI